MTIIELCQEIERRRTDALQHRISVYPRTQPIASDLGPCAREYVLAITKWQERPLPAPELKARFERGSLIEDAVLRELGSLGIQVRTEHTPFEIKDKNGRVVLRGKVDGFITVERQVFPVEVKSLDPNIFRSIQTVEDFQKYPWARKYPAQLQSYLYAHNLEYGLFLLDDCKASWRLVPVALDYVAMEEILKRCEDAVEHRDAGTLPDFHPDAEVCKRCWAFGRVCFPPIAQSGMAFADNPELETQLDRRAALEPAYREYQDLDETVKCAVTGKDGLVIGKWLVTGKEIRPRPVPPKPGYTPNPYWKSKFELLSGSQPPRGGPTTSQPPEEGRDERVG